MQKKDILPEESCCWPGLSQQESPEAEQAGTKLGAKLGTKLGTKLGNLVGT